MGQIRENLILTDEFSASFARFLQMGEQAAHRMERLGQSNEEFARSAAGMCVNFLNLCQKKIPWNGKLLMLRRSSRVLGCRGLFRKYTG